MQGDFGCVRDSKGRNQFSPFLLTLIDDAPAEAEEWVTNWLARGYTHAFFAPEYGYPGSPIPGKSFTAAQFVQKLVWLLDHGISPVVWLADMPDWAARGLEIVQLLKDKGMIPFVILTPGCEVINGTWQTGACENFLIQVIAIAGPELELGFHQSPHRWSYSSNPVQPDDPFQGDEKACWWGPAGVNVKVHFYQLEHGRDYADKDWQPWKWADYEFADNPLPPEEEDRFRDGLYRLGQGHNGWRVIPICASETILWNDYRNQFVNGEKFAKRVAGRMRDVAAEYGVTITYLNGTPN